MKTMMILALILLVAVGIWNSPKAAHDDGYSVVRSMKLTGEVLSISSVLVDEAIVYEPVKAEAVPWAEYTDCRVKTANEIAKRQAEWAGDKYGNAYLPGASMQDCQTPKAITPPKIEKQYGPKPAEMSLWLQGLNGAAHD